MKKEYYFFTTRKPKNLYNFLVIPAKKDAEKILKKKLKILYITEKFPTLDFVIFAVYLFFNGTIFNNIRLINTYYKGYLVGRYVLSTSLRLNNPYKNNFKLLLTKLKYLYSAGVILNFFEKFNDKILAAYIDHGMYINGIYVQGFQKKKKIIYSNNYPRGIFRYESKYSKKIYLYDHLIKLKPFKVNNKKKLFLIKKVLKNILYKPDFIPWMNNARFIKIKHNDYKKFTHVVYAHSFFETPFIFGFDGFLTYFEWLVFTINELLKKNSKILVKAHPNFYSNITSELVRWDNLLFNKIKSKYQSNRNVFFLDYAVRNIDLLEKIDTKAILITRHSTAVLESLFLNFKVISSSAIYWRGYYQISNQWNGIDDYKNLLEKDWSNLNFCSKNDLYNLSYDLFLNKKNHFGDANWVKLVSDIFKVSVNELNNKFFEKKLDNKKILNIQKLITSKSIGIVNND